MEQRNYQRIKATHHRDSQLMGFRCTWDFPSRTYWHRTVDHVHEALAYWLVHCREKDEQTQSYMEIYGISLSYIDLEEHGRTFHMSQASFGH